LFGCYFSWDFLYCGCHPLLPLANLWKQYILDSPSSFWLVFKAGQNIILTNFFFEKTQSKSASIEVEIDEQYVAVYTICAAQLNCKFPALGYNR
jgi:hypothetical protein